MKPVVFVDVGWLGALALLFWKPLLVLGLILTILVTLSFPILGQMAVESAARAATPVPVTVAPVWQTALALAAPTPVQVP